MMPERWSIPPDTPIFLDLEASGLSDGFPIEVGWSWCQGGKVMMEACLIKPVQKWLDDFDTRWSLESERVHGILLKDLAYDGYPVDRTFHQFPVLLLALTEFFICSLTSRYFVFQ